MIEVVDNKDCKRMARVMCGFECEGNLYVIYLIDRDKFKINVFVSKVISNSEGVRVIDSNFSDSEKGLVEGVCKRLFAKDSVDKLLSDGIKILHEVKIDNGINRMDIDKSYIASLSRDEIDVCMMYYEFDKESNKKVIKVLDKKSKGNGVNIGNVIVLIMAIFVVFVCVYLLIDILKK